MTRYDEPSKSWLGKCSFGKLYTKSVKKTIAWFPRHNKSMRTRR